MVGPYVSLHSLLVRPSISHCSAQMRCLLRCRGNGMSLAVMGKRQQVPVAWSVNHVFANSFSSSCIVSLAVFITANVSGGHLNPAVTLATMFTGHIKIVRGISYIFMQICGACFGILMVVRIYAYSACSLLCSVCLPVLQRKFCNILP